MVRVHDILIDYANVPPAVQAAEAIIDNFLTAPAWTDEQTFRDFTVVWANFGGITVAKARGLAALLKLYERVGRWDIQVLSTNNTQWVIRFSRE